VDVRVIAATNKPLEEAVAQKVFREDLFYRLNVVRIRLPALRQRIEDIRLLVDYFLQKFGRKSGGSTRGVHAEALRLLEAHHWPGNVRELENVIQRALVVRKADAIMVADLPPEITAARPETAQAVSAERVMPVVPAAAGVDDVAGLAAALFNWARLKPSAKVLPAVERELVICALEETKGNQVQAAKLLGITRATLRKRIEKFGIQRELSIR